MAVQPWCSWTRQAHSHNLSGSRCQARHGAAAENQASFAGPAQHWPNMPLAAMGAGGRHADLCTPPTENAVHTGPTGSDPAPKLRAQGRVSTRPCGGQSTALGAARHARLTHGRTMGTWHGCLRCAGVCGPGLRREGYCTGRPARRKPGCQARGNRGKSTAPARRRAVAGSVLAAQPLRQVHVLGPVVLGGQAGRGQRTGMHLTHPFDTMRQRWPEAPSPSELIVGFASTRGRHLRAADMEGAVTATSKQHLTTARPPKHNEARVG